MCLHFVEEGVDRDQTVGVETVLGDLRVTVTEMQDEDVAVTFEVRHARQHTALLTRE